MPDRDVTPPEAVPDTPSAAKWPRQSDVKVFYGEPESHQTMLMLPYADRSREPERERGEDAVGPRWFVPFKRSKGCDTTPEQKRLNRVLAGLRSAVEHPFRVLKRQFGFGKVRYRGLFKNEQHLFTRAVHRCGGFGWWVPGATGTRRMAWAVAQRDSLP